MIHRLVLACGTRFILCAPKLGRHTWRALLLDLGNVIYASRVPLAALDVVAPLLANQASTRYCYL